MPYAERAQFFDSRGASLLGIVALPTTPRPVGVAIVVGGPQYRVGSHRQFVLLARALADAGFASIRFDYRGMGDADGEPATFETIDDDVRRALDVLQREAGTPLVVLIGLCDGASAALRYCTDDARVCGVVAINPWVRSPNSEARARLRFYYLKRVASPAFWRKLATGAFAARDAARDVATAVATVARTGRSDGPSFLARMHDGWCDFSRPILGLLSGNDLTAREFEQWIDADPARRNASRRPNVTVIRLNDADHTFSRASDRAKAELAITEWIDREVVQTLRVASASR